MRKVREVARLRFGLGLSNREVARSLGIASSTVTRYEQLLKAAGLGWPLEMDDAALRRAIRVSQGTTPQRPLPPIDYLVRELRKKHVTLALLWAEYKEAHPDGYQYTQFCEYYRRGRERLDLVLRQEHKAGEKMFVDFAGDTVPVIDATTGEARQASVFVAVLGASSYTYAEATFGQGQAAWIGANIRAFEFFGGVTEIQVPDNTKTAVRAADRYEPDINPIYQDMAAHYGFAVIPARALKPRDKAKVEAAVLLVERWILAALRKHTFFSLQELNAAIRELVVRLNNRRFRRIPATRAQLYEQIDKPALRPLPPERYPFVAWKTAKVGIDYHVEVDRHYYSVPYQLVGERVDVRIGLDVIEVLHGNRRVASHARSFRIGGYTTDPAHRPAAHQRYLEWSPSRLIAWAKQTGPATAELVEAILQTRPHPEQGYRSCLGIMRLSRRYGADRLEAACRRALDIRALSYKSVKSILSAGLDRMPRRRTIQMPTAVHENVRGSRYYEDEEAN
jgi:transposase